MSKSEQHTIRETVSISGTGLHSGKRASVKFRPSKVDSGIVFVRGDLPGRPRTKADLRSVSGTARGTSLGGIQTVEHILSALYALSVTNLEIEMSGAEPPALDGSSKPYCDLIKKAGVAAQGSRVKSINITEPVFVLSGEKGIVALPSDRFRVSFMINYPIDFIGTQFYKFEFSVERYVREIAPARTYGFMDEVASLNRQGLAKGANSENAVAIGKNGYLTRLRFKDELVRHKILDLIGDLSLLGVRIKGHIIGIRSGHDLNIKLAKKLALR
jgi:UDP-3-O-[3-hydroxymyristoyl] N-acetylglucosamine deacetylase